MIPRPPTTDAVLDIGGKVPLMAFSAPLRRRENGFCEKEKQNPMRDGISVLGGAVSDFGEKEGPVILRFEGDMSKRRYSCRKDLRNGRK